MLIRNATVLSMDPDVGDLTPGDVLVEDDRIVAVGTGLADPGGEVLDAAGCIVVPGFVDTHRHMWEALIRGRVPGGSLEDYFRRVVQGIGPELTPDEVAAGEALSARAALDAGITTVQDTADIHDVPARTDAVVAALRESGLRTVLGYGVSQARVGRSGGEFPEDVGRVRAELLSDDDALVTMALAMPNTDDDAERHNAATARELGLRASHHVRATIRPSWLRELGALLPGGVFIHGNGLDTGELALIADSGGSLSISPVVEMALRLGHPVVGEALAVPGLPITLSLDVEATGPTDMFTQMRIAYLAGRMSGATAGGGALTPRDVLHWATTNGARALGLGGRTGSITPGKQADLLVLRADTVGVAPVADPYGAVVLQMDRAHVDTVLVAGTVHRRRGRPVRDDTALLDRARAALRRLTALGVLEPPVPASTSAG